MSRGVDPNPEANGRSWFNLTEADLELVTLVPSAVKPIL